jgi:hypothetical protein
VTVSVEMIRGVRRDSGETFWLLEKTVTAPKPPTRRQWADSRTCASMSAALKGLEAVDIPKARLDPPQTADLIVVADGSGYSIETPASYPGGAAAQLRLTASDDSPVAKAVDGALTALQPCWRDKPPF